MKLQSCFGWGGIERNGKVENLKTDPTVEDKKKNFKENEIKFYIFSSEFLNNQLAVLCVEHTNWI